MPVGFSIDVPHQVVFVKATGTLSFEELRDEGDRMRSHPDFRPTFNQLLDLRDVTIFELSNEQVRALGTRNVFAPESRRALLANQGLQFGIARMFGTHRELEGDLGIKVFTGVKEARLWVRLPEATETAD